MSIVVEGGGFRVQGSGFRDGGGRVGVRMLDAGCGALAPSA